MFKIRILGTSSAIPAFGRLPSAQLVMHNDRGILLDCGEGTQFQLNRYRFRYKQLDVVLISHLHGDHVFGLPGMLTTMNMLSRTQPLVLIGPEGLETLLRDQFRLTDSHVEYDIQIQEIPAPPWGPDTGLTRQVFENRNLIIEALPLSHRLTCYGYILREKPRKRRFLVHEAYAWGVPNEYFGLIKAGNDYTTPEGEVLPAERFLGDPPPSHSYAYCTDTAFLPEHAHILKGVDMLYHEATFMEAHAENARNTGHSTARQAAELARLAEVETLVVGHYSARYPDLAPLLEEARSVFPNTELALEGRVFEIPHVPRTSRSSSERDEP